MNLECLKKEKVYLIDKISHDIILINFPIKNSVKVLSFFKKFSSKEIEEYKERIQEICNVELRLDDYLGKTFLTVFHFFYHETDLIIVNTAGLSEQSIVFLEKNLQILTSVLKKIAIVNR